jgi:hypothetical protein
MIEEGRHIPYIEHWHRDEAVTSPCVALRLRESRARTIGFIVRVGNLFMYARDRAGVVPADQRLIECVRNAPTLEDAQSLVDIEISFGLVEPQGWLILHSSLPFKERRTLDPETLFGDGLRTSDLTPDGRLMERSWHITHVQGDIAQLTDQRQLFAAHR